MLPGPEETSSTVASQEEFAQAQPGEGEAIAFVDPGIGGCFETKLWGPDKRARHVAESFHDGLGIIERHTDAKDEQKRQGIQPPLPVMVQQGLRIHIQREGPTGGEREGD